MSIKQLFLINNFSTLEKILNEKLRQDRFTISFITVHQVQIIIRKLDSNKATDLDELGPRILRQCGAIITPAIPSIINNRIASGIYPDELKIARVIPIFKSGDRDDPNNYRPISILPTISKILERHIPSLLQIFFENTKILNQSQSGFRQNHSCVTALSKMVNTWITDIDEGNYVGSVFLSSIKRRGLAHTLKQSSHFINSPLV